MSRNQKRNPIIDAADREDQLARNAGVDDDLDVDFDDEEIDVDTMMEAVNALPEKSRQALDATRQRGRAPHTRDVAHPGRGREEAHEPEDRSRGLVWSPSNHLFAPPPREGMEQRWIRCRLGEKDDVQNFQKKLRQHWQPVKLENMPKNYYAPSIEFSGFGSVVAIGDLILCERPATVGLQRAKYFKQVLQRQIDSSDRRHVRKVERADHLITGGARQDMKPSVGRGSRTRSTPVQADEE